MWRTNSLTAFGSRRIGDFPGGSFRNSSRSCFTRSSLSPGCTRIGKGSQRRSGRQGNLPPHGIEESCEAQEGSGADLSLFGEVEARGLGRQHPGRDLERASRRVENDEGAVRVARPREDVELPAVHGVKAVVDGDGGT